MERCPSGDRLQLKCQYLMSDGSCYPMPGLWDTYLETQCTVQREDNIDPKELRCYPHMSEAIAIFETQEDCEDFSKTPKFLGVASYYEGWAFFEGLIYDLREGNAFWAGAVVVERSSSGRRYCQDVGSFHFHSGGYLWKPFDNMEGYGPEKFSNVVGAF